MRRARAAEQSEKRIGIASLAGRPVFIYEMSRICKRSEGIGASRAAVLQPAMRPQSRVGALETMKTGVRTIFRRTYAAAIAAAIWLIASNAASAGDVHIGPVTDYVGSNVRSWATDPLIITALRESNTRNAALTAADISALDGQWREEFSSDVQPLITSILNNPLSRFLKEKQIAAGGAITEIFVMDAKGLSIGESEISSDYWQGDELKWQMTFLVGGGALFVDRAEKDESTQTLQSQASLTISDPQSGQPIGAITIGINLDAL